MGWLFPYGASRKSLIAERVKNWERTTDSGVLITTTCIAHCYRGGVFSGVLWSVWERAFLKDGVDSEPRQRWIQCDLLRCERGEWGYKDMEESMHRTSTRARSVISSSCRSSSSAAMKNGGKVCGNTTLSTPINDGLERLRNQCEGLASVETTPALSSFRSKFRLGDNDVRSDRNDSP